MISVIIPTYNVEDYLHICLNSVLKQSYQDFEIICIDDASTDSTLEILEYFCEKDSRIKFYQNDANKGPGYTKNVGMELSQGKYLFFLDADDWLSPNAFEMFIEKAESDNSDLLLFNNIAYDELTNDFLIDSEYNTYFLNKFEDNVFNLYDLDNKHLFEVPNSCNKLFLKSFLDENSIRFSNDKRIYEDYPFFYKVMSSAKRVSFINDFLYNTRIGNNSLKNINDERLLDSIDITNDILDIFLKNYYLYKAYKKELFIFINHLLQSNYNKIDDLYKEEFINKIKDMLKKLIKENYFYFDLKENIDKSLLNKLDFEDIAGEVLKDHPKISIVIPVYNCEKFLERCLDSVVNQTLDDIEIICINDGSTDKSADILNEFKEKDERIYVFSQENMGPASARNKGIELAKGEYLIFIDSDDYVEPNMCEELYNQAENLGSDLVLFNATEHNLENEFRNRFYFPENAFKEDYTEFSFDYNFNKKLVLNHFLVVWSKMFRLDLVKNIKFPNLPIFEDVSFHVETMLLADRISYIPELFYHYMKLNVNSEQNLKAKTEKSLCIVDVFRYIYKILRENNFCSEFNINYLTFVFRESRGVLNRIDEEYKEILFEELKVFYNSLKISYGSIKELSGDLAEFYYDIIRAETYCEFLTFQEN